MALIHQKFRTVQTNLGVGLSYFCPGCQEMHAITTQSTTPNRGWNFNGNFECATITPSIKTTSGHYAEGWRGPHCWCTFNRDQIAHGLEPSRFQCFLCHCYITNGEIQFLNDCTHGLKGQIVPIPDIPDEYQ